MINIPNFEEYVPLYRFYFNATQQVVNTRCCEFHPNDISASDHEWKHHYGTICMSGGIITHNALTSGLPNANGNNTCISISSIINMDDNFKYTIINSQTGTTKFSQDLGILTASALTYNNSAIMNITYNASNGELFVTGGTRFPFKWNVVNNLPQYMPTSGIWTDVTNNYYFVYFVYSLQDDAYGQSVRLRSAHQDFATLLEAQNYNWVNLLNYSLTLRDKEIRPIARLILDTKTSYAAAVKYTCLREVKDIRNEPVIY